MRFIVFTLVSMLVLSSNLYSQNLGIKVFCSETNWSVRRFINNINSFDTNRTEEIRNQQSKVMDYGLGLTAQFKKNKNNLIIGLNYEVNSLRSIAKRFNSDGMLIRRYNLHYLNLQISLLREMQLGNKKIQVGAGVISLLRIRNQRTMSQSRLTYISSTQFGSSYAQYEEIEIQNRKNGYRQSVIVPGFQCEAKIELARNQSGTYFLFSNSSITFGPALGYRWYFMGTPFAFYQSNRLSVCIGVHYVFFK